MNRKKGLCFPNLGKKRFILFQTLEYLLLLEGYDRGFFQTLEEYGREFPGIGIGDSCKDFWGFCFVTPYKQVV